MLSRSTDDNLRDARAKPIMTIKIELICPKCGGSCFTVADTIALSNGTRKRYRQCANCKTGRSIPTREIPESTFQRLLRAAGG